MQLILQALLCHCIFGKINKQTENCKPNFGKFEILIQKHIKWVKSFFFMNFLCFIDRQFCYTDNTLRVKANIITGKWWH